MNYILKMSVLFVVFKNLFQTFKYLLTLNNIPKQTDFYKLNWSA